MEPGREVESTRHQNCRKTLKPLPEMQDDDDAEPAMLSMAPKMLSREQSGGGSGHFFQPGRTGSSDTLLFISSAAGVNRTGSGSFEGNAAPPASDDPLVHYPFKRKHTILETVQDVSDSRINTHTHTHAYTYTHKHTSSSPRRFSL